MKKILIFLFGIFAYIVFLGAFLYAIGFVGNFIVPKSIDTGVESSFLQALLVNSLILSVFALQHSIMARPAFKRWWTKIVPKAAERSVYVLLSSLALLLIFWQWQPVKAIVWEVENPTLVLIIQALYFSGWLIILLSSFMINHFHLFGLKQIYDNFKNNPSSNMKFRKVFLYQIVRHPLMFGFLISFWATPLMTMGHFMFTIITSLYIYIAVKFLEERDLRKELGSVYEQYQEEVPMLIPFLKRRKKKKVGKVVIAGQN